MAAALALSIAAAAPAAAAPTAFQSEWATATIPGGGRLTLSLSGLATSATKSGDLTFQSYIDCGDGTSMVASIGDRPVDDSPSTDTGRPTQGVFISPTASAAHVDYSGVFNNPCPLGGDTWFELKFDMAATAPKGVDTLAKSVDNQATGTGTFCWNPGFWPQTSPDVCTALTSTSGDIGTQLSIYG